jgi:hypothetical protein
MSDERGDTTEPTLVEKWIKDQQEWQKMAMEYFDSMVKNDEFLVHLGNAMRGSLLAGKAYPGSEPPDSAPEGGTADDRIDEILHALHRLEGDMADLKMTVEDLKRGQTLLRASLERLSRLERPQPPRNVVSPSADGASSAAPPGGIERS